MDGEDGWAYRGIASLASARLCQGGMPYRVQEVARAFIIRYRSKIRGENIIPDPHNCSPNILTMRYHIYCSIYCTRCVSSTVNSTHCSGNISSYCIVSHCPRRAKKKKKRCGAHSFILAPFPRLKPARRFW